MDSVVQNGFVVLQQGAVYRARLRVVPPYGAGATQDGVRSALASEGFVNISFYDPRVLPADWPANQRDSSAGFLGAMYFLEGAFALSSRQVALSKLGGMVDLKDMWIYAIPPVQPSVPSEVPSNGSYVPIVPQAQPDQSVPGVTTPNPDESAVKTSIGAWLIRLGATAAAATVTFTLMRRAYAHL